MSWILRTAALAGVATMTLLGGPLAHADDASYIAALDAHHVFPSGPPNARLSAGHRFCSQLRGGETPEEIAATFPRRPSFGGPSMVDDLQSNPRPVIDIAQHELCPDTLG